MRRRRSSKSNALRTCATLLCAFVGVQSSSSVAKDLQAIAEFVIPAYTAMNFTALCAQDDPWFIVDARGPRGNALEYAEHVKDEAIASLTHDESATVLKLAADEARSAARNELRKLISDYPTYRYGEIADWCRGDAMRFVRAFIEQHDMDHTTLLRGLEKAKQ